MQTENQLIKDCINKRKGAMDELYKRFAPKMFGICMRYAKCKMEAEDFLQEGFIKVFTNLDSFRCDGSLEGWIRRIIVNNIINSYRQKKPYFEDIDTCKEAYRESVDSEILSDLTAEELLRLVHELPEGYRVVFNLYVVEGYQHKEIAEMLNVSESTSKTQLLKARKALQEKIKSVVYEQAI